VDGVRWDGDWHLAKEGLGCLSLRLLRLLRQRLEGLTVINVGTRKECHRDKREKGGGKRRKRVVKKFVKKTEEGRIDWDLEANAQRRRAPLTIFWLDWYSGSRRQSVLGKREIPEEG